MFPKFSDRAQPSAWVLPRLWKLNKIYCRDSFTTYRSVFQSFRAAEFSPSEVLTSNLQIGPKTVPLRLWKLNKSKFSEPLSLVNSVSQIFRSGSEACAWVLPRLWKLNKIYCRDSFTTYRSVFQSFRAAEVSPSEFMKLNNICYRDLLSCK